MIIKSGCKHKMRAEESQCSCQECGTVCLGQYSGCPEVWDRRDRSYDPIQAGVAASPPDYEPAAWPAVIRHVPPPRARTAERTQPRPPPPDIEPLVVPAAVPPPPPLPLPPAPPARRQPPIPVRAAPPPAFEGARDLDEWFQQATAELSARAFDIDERAEAHARAFEHDRAWLERMLNELPTRARELDARIAAHLEAVPSLVVDAVRGEYGAKAGPDPIVNINARQRSLEKRIEAIARRAQEIDERVGSHLRTIEDDRGVLADVVRHQDRLAQQLSEVDVGERHKRLTEWVHEAIPAVAASAVDAALGAQTSSIAAAVARAERIRSDMQVAAEQNQAAAERMLEALFRRDKEIVDQLQALQQEREAVAAIIEGGRDEIAHSVLNSLPALVDVAVRTAMERYATERRSGVTDLSNRLRADADVMRDAMQRSFEKIMESLAVKEQLVDERAAAHLRSLEHDRTTVTELWQKAARSVTDALPSLVADAVASAGADSRDEVERLRRDNEAALADLNQAVAELKEALVDRDGVVQRQAAAYERALDGLRSAISRPAGEPTTRPARLPEPVPTSASASASASGAYDPRGRVKLGRSNIPREQRVERRMLKLDDRDDAAWPALGRREAALTDLLDGPDG